MFFIYFFFLRLSLPLRTVKNKNAYIFFKSIFFDRKVNLVVLWGFKSKKIREKQMKIKGKRECLRKIDFRHNRSWFLV